MKNLEPEELDAVRKIWRDLREGVPKATDQLRDAPDSVWSMIMKELVRSIHNGKTEEKPLVKTAFKGSYLALGKHLTR